MVISFLMTCMMHHDNHEHDDKNKTNKDQSKNISYMVDLA